MQVSKEDSFILSNMWAHWGISECEQIQQCQSQGEAGDQWAHSLHPMTETKDVFLI